MSILRQLSIQCQRRLGGLVSRVHYGEVQLGLWCFAEAFHPDGWIVGLGQRDRLPTGFRHLLDHRQVLAEQMPVAIVPLGVSEIGIRRSVLREEPGKHAVEQATLHVLLDQLGSEVVVVRIHEEHVWFVPGHGPFQVHVVRRGWSEAVVPQPVGFGAHHIQGIGQPGETVRHRVGHQQLAFTAHPIGHMTREFVG